MISLSLPTLDTARLTLLLPPLDAAERMLDYRTRNKGHLSPWEPPRPPQFFSRSYWEESLHVSHEEAHRGTMFRFALVANGEPNGPILGTCDLAQIVRGPSQSALLGFGLDPA